jgi:hypothetical protein
MQQLNSGHEWHEGRLELSTSPPRNLKTGNLQLVGSQEHSNDGVKLGRRNKQLSGAQWKTCKQQY